MTALDVGPLVLGGNTFGWTSDRAETFAVLDAFVDAGGRTVDTADSYPHWAPGSVGGDSETMIGEWLTARPGMRDRVVLATKVFSHPDHLGLSPATVRGAVEDSLRRLHTDHLDLYYAHHDDPDVPQEEVVAVFDELVRAGRIREAGASNFTAERLRSAVGIARSEGLTPFTVSQDHFNLVELAFATELAPTLEELGIVELPYYALASGFLTGKYRPGSTVDSPRVDRAGRLLDDPRNLALLDTLDDIAATHGVSIAAVSLAWLRQQPTVAAPIASARTPEQLVDLVQSFTLELSDEELGRLG